MASILSHPQCVKSYHGNTFHITGPLWGESTGYQHKLQYQMTSWGWVRAQGPISLTVFPSQFKFDGNFVSLSSQFWYSDYYKILYMAQQLCCRGMCKNLLRSDGQQRNYSKVKFPSNLNCRQKIVSETGPRSWLIGWWWQMAIVSDANTSHISDI